MLHLYQEITLLSLKDEKGTVSIQNLAQVLAGALVAELIVSKRISVTNDKKRFVDLIDPKPTGDALLDDCLQKLAEAKRRARLQTWVGRFAAIKRLHHKAAQSLCDRGILEQTTDKVLLVFNRTIYPEVDPKPEQKILARLENAIFSEKSKLSTEDILLVSLADASGLLDQIYTRKRLKPYRQRIKQIVEGEIAGQATREVITAIQTAIIVSAIIIPVVTASH
ncbi:hypothetical protein VDG1235_4385 [Verrucomicrobiia bacterium DG1235]|nr:hypothetical protein VDG1235_4385 [Verrucomicrobiae bacterium DG1235]